MSRLGSFALKSGDRLRIRGAGRFKRHYIHNVTERATNPLGSSLSRGYKNRLVITVTGTFLLFGLVYFVAETPRQRILHGLSATQRTGRVASTLLRCILDYRKTLNAPFGSDEERKVKLGACHKRCAERTLKAMEQNGSIFIKLGQHLSSMDYLLPSEWTTTFIPLQDRCPVSSYESIEGLLLQDTKQSVGDMFESFDRDPVAAASLAQVHLATLKGSEEKVAVKVQHPVLEEWVPLDLILTRTTFRILKWFFPAYDLQWLSQEMDSSLPQELNFALEGNFAMQTKRHFETKINTPLVVPDVKWCSKRILVMEYISGHRIDDLEYLDSSGIDRDEVSAALAHIFNEMIFGDTPLHCDPHGGNIAIRRNAQSRRHNFDIILYDHGLYRDIPLQLRRDYAKLWLAVIDADEPKMREYSNRVAGIKDDQFPLFASVITGRDYETATQSIASKRTDKEKETISGAMAEGMLQELVQLLGDVPRIILLILKTNDLTRSLDENLQTREGPARSFLILARYCSLTVFEEQRALVRGKGSLCHPKILYGLLKAWTAFMRVECKLTAFEWYISLRRLAGLSTVFKP